MRLSGNHRLWYPWRPHGFRGNHAQELRKKLEDEGLTPEEIELIITQDLGRNRGSMARHYLGV
jgi:hypothetical protein